MVKRGLAHVLKATGLFDTVRRLMIRTGWHTPVPHGHILVIQAMGEKANKNGGTLEGAVCVEIGSTREAVPGQGSTVELARKCHELGVLFITVDMDPDNTSAAQEALTRINGTFLALNRKGEDFLKSYCGRIDFLYLDAFDIDHQRHSKKRRERYRAFLNSDITDDACHQMHRACAVEAQRIMAGGGDIIFDDAWQNGGVWDGKGYSAIPFLLDNEFYVVTELENSVWLRRLPSPSI